MTGNKEIKCTLNKNANSKVEIVAGSHIPIIHYEGLGYFDHETSMTKKD